MKGHTSTQVKAQFDPDKLSLTEYKLIKGSIETPEDFDSEKVVGHKLETDLQIGFDLSSNAGKADLTVDIVTESKKQNKTEAKGSFHFVYGFSVENLGSMAKLKDKFLEIDPALGNAISSISYSTSRGVLLTLLQGTALHKFILPVINPNKLLKRK